MLSYSVLPFLTSPGMAPQAVAGQRLAALPWTRTRGSVLPGSGEGARNATTGGLRGAESRRPGRWTPMPRTRRKRRRRRLGRHRPRPRGPHPRQGQLRRQRHRRCRCRHPRHPRYPRLPHRLAVVVVVIVVARPARPDRFEPWAGRVRIVVLFVLVVIVRGSSSSFPSVRVVGVGAFGLGWADASGLRVIRPPDGRRKGSREL